MNTSAEKTHSAAPAASAGSDTGFFSSGTSIIQEALSLGLLIIIIFVVCIVFIKTIRFIFEIYYAKNLRYLKVTLPRSDSKLDKERETKKDFKEKMGMMSLFYKAIHKLSEAGLKDTFLNAIFKHSKISLELAYNK